MPPSSRDVGRTKARRLMSGRAWIAIATLASAAGLASFAEATPSGAAIHSSAKSAVCESFDTLSGDLASAPGSQIFKDVGNLGEVAGKSGSSRAVTQDGTELAALAKGSSLTEKQLVNATKAIASACGHPLGVNVKTVAIPSSMHSFSPLRARRGPRPCRSRTGRRWRRCTMPPPARANAKKRTCENNSRTLAIGPKYSKAGNGALTRRGAPAYRVRVAPELVAEGLASADLASRRFDSASPARIGASVAFGRRGRFDRNGTAERAISSQFNASR